MIGKKIIKFDSLDSTNTYIKENSYKLDHGDIVWSLEQTFGKGRYGNKWESKVGNLYLSLLIKNKEYAQNIFGLHIKASVVVIDLLKEYGIDARIKYPNDIVVGRKKISGMLIETQGEDIVILGIGINVNQAMFNDLKDKAISMNILKKKKYALDDVLKEFIDIYNRNMREDIYYKRYLEKSIIIGEKITYRKKDYFIDNVNQNGQLVLADNSHNITVDYDRLSFSHLYYE